MENSYDWIAMERKLDEWYQHGDFQYDEQRIAELSHLPEVSLTDEQYAQAEGKHCPVCESDSIEGIGPFESNDGVVTIPVKCYSCGARWSDVYTLVGYDCLEHGEAEEPY